MAKTYYEPDEKGRMRITEKRGDKTPINIAVNKDPGNYYRRKAKWMLTMICQASHMILKRVRNEAKNFLIN